MDSTIWLLMGRRFPRSTRDECDLAVQPDGHAGPGIAVRNQPRRSSDRRTNRLLLVGGIDSACRRLAARGGQPLPRLSPQLISDWDMAPIEARCYKPLKLLRLISSDAGIPKASTVVGSCLTSSN